MANNSLITSVSGTQADAVTGKQKPYWIDIQLVDEQGDAVANMPWIVESHHPVSGLIEQFTYSGQSDAEGWIHVNMPHGLELRLTLDGNKLATEMEKRLLRPGRDVLNDSTVRRQAEAQGYHWHYAVIGELCRTMPDIQLRKKELLPPFHFPAHTAFTGVKFRTNELNRRHVIEICPFRAWELVLHHQKNYSIVNAHNLGGMAYLAYYNDEYFDKDSILSFFTKQCLDLSQLPIVYDAREDDKNRQDKERGRKLKGFVCQSIVQDVPFSERYYRPVFMDTASGKVNKEDEEEDLQEEDESSTIQKKEEELNTSPDGDTQLFYVYNNSQVIVAWRGTESLYDAGTDISFRPVNIESCDYNKTQCTTLLSAGKVHTGFWSGYCRAAKKFFSKMQRLERRLVTRKLFICGHSLGGSLALIHSAKLKNDNPLLYTYGMPRTFTRDAIAQLGEIPHFRHVNDKDPAPAVPMDANLDNELYRLWGVIGGTLGFFWSVGEYATYKVMPWGDCFWHHGNTVAFLAASQHQEWHECKRALPVPASCITVRGKLPISVKLYLVPALAQQEMQQAGQQQEEFKASLTAEDLNEFFPMGNNPARGVVYKVFDHSMTAYITFMNSKLLDLINKSSIVEGHEITGYQRNLELFKEQMTRNKGSIPEKEYARNELFLKVESLLNTSLAPTLATQPGKNALLRFMQFNKEVMAND